MGRGRWATLQSWYMGFSLRWLLLVQSVGSEACSLQEVQRMGSVVAACKV